MSSIESAALRLVTRPVLVAVVCGGLIMGMALGIRHVQGLFLIPMTMDRHWSRESFGFAIALQNLVWGLAQPFTGMIADRFGAAKVIAIGTVLYLVGLLFMAHAASTPWFTFGAGFVIGVALSGTTFGAVYGALSRIVPAHRRSWALGLAGAIGGLGQFVMVPLTQALQHALGWALALVVLGFAIAALTPAARSLSTARSDGEAVPSKQPMGAAIREAFRHRGFWLLNAGFLACGFQLAFIASYLPAYLLDKGLGAKDGVAGLALIALGNIVGTYAFGAWGGLYRRKYLLAGLYLTRTATIALFLLLPLTPASLYLFCAVMGFLWLGTVPLTSGLVSGVFGVRYVATLFGFVFFGHQLGAFLGIWLGGVVYGATHSYNAIWIVAMVLGIVAAMLHLPIDDRPMERAAARPLRWGDAT